MDDYSVSAARFFGDSFLLKGPTPKGVDWGTEFSQDERLRVLMKLVPDEDVNYSLGDVGSGYGRLVELLGDRKFHSYTGYEISSDLYEYARLKFAPDPRIRFKLNENFSDVCEHDYILMSGLFNKKFGMADSEFLDYIKTSLTLLSRKSKKGLAVNFLSSFSDLDKRREDLHYANPMDLFDFVKSTLTPEVSLLHDYGLWDFTLFLRFNL